VADVVDDGPPDVLGGCRVVDPAALEPGGLVDVPGTGVTVPVPSITGSGSGGGAADPADDRSAADAVPVVPSVRLSSGFSAGMIVVPRAAVTERKTLR
jgi:hypothetical protein